ncbi:MAG TPA: Rieske 2Fe-2S domain-containing protein [Chloroflexota bacterium]|nr:Rieske 2Fe-2S domain-containing protein [Chloroflexota bacterium]
MPMIEEKLDRTIVSQAWLDRIAEPLQQIVSDVLRPGPLGTPLRDLLNGNFLGHPLHPALTDVPIGSWTFAFLADTLDSLPGGRRLRPGATLAVGLGIAGALGSALSGLADWSYTDGNTRRLGVTHGLLNIVATALYGGSLALRLRGRHATARGLASAGYGIVLFSSYLGGELVYRCGLGVDHATFEPTVSDFTDALPEGGLPEGQMRRAMVSGVPILLTRYLGQIYAMGDTCTHLGCSLSEGRLDGDVVTCPCHDSQFRVTDGAAVRGPASFPEVRFDTRVNDGMIQVRSTAPTC